jgi:SAM-dependent methyltransferase
MAKAPLRLQTTTLWSYPSQHFDERHETQHQGYRGATPDYILWNLLSRYTRPKELIVDPMCGSGTTVVVAREMGRRALGYDIRPAHPDVFRADARKLPLENEKADFCFVDPPYSDHIKYSGLPECIGELSALREEYYVAMQQVICELYRVLRPERYLALYVHDSFEKGKPFMPIGYRLFEMLSKKLVPVDAIAIVRNNKTLLRNHFHTAAAEHNYYLRGFGHLMVFYKPSPRQPLPLDRRDPAERARQIQAFDVNSSEESPSLTETSSHETPHEPTHRPTPGKGYRRDPSNRGTPHEPTHRPPHAMEHRQKSESSQPRRGPNPKPRSR